MFTSFHLNGRLCSSDLIRHIAAEAKTPYTFLITKPDIEWVYRAQERMLQVLQMTHAKMVYADHFQRICPGTQASSPAQGGAVFGPHQEITPLEAPVIDYQLGALRDDFDFGAVMLWDTNALQEAAARMTANYSSIFR